MDIRVILSQLIMLFAMMLMGYGIWKKHWLDEDSYQKLSKIVVNIFNPLLVVYGVMGKSSEGNQALLLRNLGLVVGYYAVLWALGFVILWILRPRQSERPLYRLMTMFPNVGFMGIPVITSILGNDAMIYIVFYMLGFNLLVYTYGIILSRKSGEMYYLEKSVDFNEKSELSQRAAGASQRTVGNGKAGFQWKRILNSGVIASVGAIMIFLFQIPVPDMVAGFCDYVGNATIPLSMMLIGVSIAKVNLKVIFSSARIYVFTAVRNVLFPIVIITLVKIFFSVDPLLLGVFGLELSMPVGSIVTLVAKENGADESCCTNGIVLTTLLSLVTIPLVCLFI